MDERQHLILGRCPLCNSEASTPLASYPELQWVRCACGMIYKRTELPSIASQEIYQENYFTDGVYYNKRTSRRVQKSRHQLLDVLNHVGPGPVLDIGCSLGYALQAARGLGLEAVGTDVSEFAIKSCRELGFEAEVGTLGSLPFAAGRFSVVSMKHVLEHTPDPRAALRDIRRILRAHGGLFVAVPDARYRKAVHDPQKSRFYLPAAKGIQHYLYYTPQTLSRLLAEEGFRVVRVNPHLVHRHAAMPMRAAQIVTAPLRAAAQLLADGLALRKEFWLTAVRSD